MQRWRRFCGVGFPIPDRLRLRNGQGRSLRFGGGRTVFVGSMPPFTQMQCFVKRNGGGAVPYALLEGAALNVNVYAVMQRQVWLKAHPAKASAGTNDWPAHSKSCAAAGLVPRTV